MTTRIATLNIRPHGSKFADALGSRVLGYDADILVVTGFRPDATGARLLGRLAEAGYSTSYPPTEPTPNTVLVAARLGIDESWPFTEELDPYHLWCSAIGGVVLCAVSMPQHTATLPYWEALIGDAMASGVDLLVGDFNIGNSELEAPTGAQFIGPEMPGRLVGSGYIDVWRYLHPGAPEYSWFSRPGDNGFRSDYLFAVPEFAQRVGMCEFDHAPRLAGETDHSALVAAVS
ncbi:MAG: exonuclease III [Mycolicibacterium cosmeticum]|nr:exonuclease III [Mycolicibacterium cosmeticum]